MEHSADQSLSPMGIDSYVRWLTRVWVLRSERHAGDHHLCTSQRAERRTLSVRPSFTAKRR